MAAGGDVSRQEKTLTAAWDAFCVALDALQDEMGEPIVFVVGPSATVWRHADLERQYTHGGERPMVTLRKSTRARMDGGDP